MKLCLKTLLFLLFPMHNIDASEIDIPGKSFEIYLHSEYDRVFNFSGDIQLLGGIELNNLFLLRSGVSLGRKEGDIDLKSFTTANVSLFADIPLNLSLSWMYNGFFAYNVHSNTILPLISYNAKKAGISIGMNFRFTSFFDEGVIFESLFSYSIYFNFINRPKILVSFIWGNFSDFYARNTGAYSFNVLISVRINYKWQIINEIEIMQSGGFGFTNNFYGIAWKGGVRFSW